MTRSPIFGAQAPGLSDPRTACAVDAALVYALLSSGKFDLTAEKATQAAIETLLLQHIPADQVSREHRLGPGDIPDFLLGGAIVVEVKGPKHRPGPTFRQLARYVAYPQVRYVILATAKAMRAPIALLDPASGRRVPVTMVNLGRAWL